MYISICIQNDNRELEHSYKNVLLDEFVLKLIVKTINFKRSLSCGTRIYKYPPKIIVVAKAQSHISPPSQFLIMHRLRVQFSSYKS